MYLAAVVEAGVETVLPAGNVGQVRGEIADGSADFTPNDFLVKRNHAILLLGSLIG
jgi:hypothetical protein